MVNSTNTQDLDPGWIWKLLGFSKAAVSINSKGITLQKKDASFFINNKDFLEEGFIRTRLFSYELVFKSSSGEVAFGPLSHSQASSAYEFLQRYWYSSIFDEINSAYQKMNKYLTSKYIRSSEWPSIVSEARELVKRFVKIPKDGLVSESISHPFEKIQFFSEMNLTDIEQFRVAYVNRMRNEYSDYFKNIESNPLTEEQIEACIKDEDNNLVLAGAGTGKTSTMVGRAGFLLKNKQAKAEDILMIAYGRKASEEMDERVKERIKIEDLSISTFHKLGLDIVAKVENAKPSVSKLVEDERLYKRTIGEWVNEFLKDDKYKSKVIKYFEDYLFVERSPFEFETQGEFYDHIEAEEIRTFKGERVKSYGERVVANFLFMMGIEYEYERNYEIDTRTKEYRQYTPDFYLPEYEIYIEHIGWDRNKNTAPYIDKEAYVKGVEWKRDIHKKNQTHLIETFFYEHIEGELKQSLKNKLEAFGVKCTPLPEDAIIETLKEGEENEISKFADLMADLIKSYKANCFDTEKLNNKLARTPHREHLEIALELMMPLYERYEDVLKSNGDIDYEDMIGKALHYLEKGKFQPKWKYIMVDEFQDISDTRARLVKAIRDNSEKCSLFCVGDDWQAIYRFAGSDISFTTGFEKFFGATEYTKLKDTFRFNNSIAEISSRFVLSNPFQTDKTIVANKSVSQPAVSLFRKESKLDLSFAQEYEYLIPSLRADSNTPIELILGRVQQIDEVLGRIEDLDEQVSVLILSRYNYTLPGSSERDYYSRKYKKLDIKYNSVHTSKGKEADYVIVLGLISGKHGFPSEKTTNPLLEALLPELEEYEFAEERRLFYVAITRARNKVYLVTDMTRPSLFVKEILESEYPLELNEFPISEEQKIVQTFNCELCETGVMQKRINRSTNETFFSCSHWTLCKHTESGCKECGNRMKKINHNNNEFRICMSCGYWILVCKVCSSDMTLRTGQYGDFWGCTKYKPSSNLSCDNTLDVKRFVPPNSYKHGVKKKDLTTKSKNEEHTSKKVDLDKVFKNRDDAQEYAKNTAMKHRLTIRLVEKEDGSFLVTTKKA